MQRRRFLAAVGTGTLGLGAGCLGGVRTPRALPDGGTNDRTPRPAPAYRDVDLPVPEDELKRGAPKDAIPAIIDPAFASDWAPAGATLPADAPVIGVERNDEARAYPLAVLNWHEIVNDTFGGPLLVTYCPLCGSGVVADRVVDGTRRTFGVSGYLWQSDLVMYDTGTESLWSQILATAIRGPLVGTELSLLPSATTTWGNWREAHPDTEVLLPPPKSDTITGWTTRNYEQNPYAGYETSPTVGIGYNEAVDDRLHPKTRVVGVAADGVARAYPFDRVLDAGVVNDTVGNRPVVVAASEDGTMVAYVRRVDGETVQFARDGPDALAAAGSRWELVTGRATDGPHEGTTLSRANDRSPMFWFAWADFYPNTEIYGE